MQARLLVNCVEIAVITAYVDDAADDGGRRDDLPCVWKAHLTPWSFGDAASVDAGVGKIVAEHRRVLRGGVKAVNEDEERREERQADMPGVWIHDRSPRCWN